MNNWNVMNNQNTSSDRLKDIISIHIKELQNIVTREPFEKKNTLPSIRSVIDHWRPLYLELAKHKNLIVSRHYFCLCCGSECKKPERAHILTRVYGGTEVVENIIPLCRVCHKEFDRRFEIFQQNESEIIDFFNWIVERKPLDVIQFLYAKHYNFISSVNSLPLEIPNNDIENLLHKEISEYISKCYKGKYKY